MKHLKPFSAGILLALSACTPDEILPSNNPYLAIPDTHFEARLIDMGIDTDGTLNQQLLKSDAEKITRLELDFSSEYEPIKDVTGIEGFTNLTYLSITRQDIVEIDLSAHNQLDSLDLTGNFLSHLDVSGNPHLIWLNASSNGMTSIEGIEDAGNLKSVNLSYNDFEHVTMNNQSLEYLSVSDNLLKTIQLTGASHLKSALLTNNQLTVVDFTSNRRIETILISANKLTTLDLSENTALEVLYISGNALESLDVSQNQHLWNLKPDRNPDLLCIKVAEGQEIPSIRLSDYQQLSPFCEN